MNTVLTSLCFSDTPRHDHPAVPALYTETKTQRTGLSIFDTDGLFRDDSYCSHSNRLGYLMPLYLCIFCRCRLPYRVGRPLQNLTGHYGVHTVFVYDFSSVNKENCLSVCRFIATQGPVTFLSFIHTYLFAARPATPHSRPAIQIAARCDTIVDFQKPEDGLPPVIPCASEKSDVFPVVASVNPEDSLPSVIFSKPEDDFPSAFARVMPPFK